MAHYGLPSGGYVSDANLHVGLIYMLGHGFIRWFRTTRTPYDPDWNSQEDRVEEYRIAYVGMRRAFACG
jgi:hypothetical protein